MGSVHDTMKSVNSTLRTLVMMAFVGGAGYPGYQGYAIYNEPQKKLQEKELQLQEVSGQLADREKEVDSLSSEIAEKNEQIERLETAMHLLKVNRRLARLRVLDQTEDEETGDIVSDVEFVETNEEGAPIGEPMQFEIQGDMVYIDYLVAKFDDSYIEQSDLDRGTAICLFQRIFGENQEPAEGYALDEVGSRPTAYARGGKISEFEQKIWDDFWTLANDPERAKEMGIRAAHGNAASIRVRPDSTYLLELRATGEFTLRPVLAPTEPSGG